jgi:hypothetical protein
MIKHYVEHLTSIRRRTLIIAVVLMAPLATLGLAAPALAKEPTGDFAVFKQCPRFTPGVNFCLFSQVTSGEIKIGKTVVPIENTITLQGGYIRNEETGAETLVGALNGESLSKTPQNVPGGLLNLIKCKEITNEFERKVCEAIFEKGILGVTATTELAGFPGINTDNLINEEGTALTLPVRVKLDNPLLGNECYIGSFTSPITLNLTTGTTSPPKPNEPIKGKLGNLEFLDEFNLIEITNNTLVDNSFSVPKASGCGGIFSFLIDPIINAKLALPSAAGNNTAILNGTIKEATAESVIKSEK